MTPLTLRPLHRSQTSQGKCAQVAPAIDHVNDIHETQGGVAGGNVPNLLTVLKIGGEKILLKNVTHGMLVLLVG